MGELSPWHWAIVLLAFVLLFGYRKLPDAARGIGRSMRIFKAEMAVGAAEPSPGGESATGGAPATGDETGSPLTSSPLTGTAPAVQVEPPPAPAG